jgi:hypothetical protein
MSPDAESIGIWFKGNEYPDSIGAPDATFLGAVSARDSIASYTGPVCSTYYFYLSVKDSGDNWSLPALLTYSPPTGVPHAPLSPIPPRQQSITIRSNPSGGPLEIRIAGDDINGIVICRILDMYGKAVKTMTDIVLAGSGNFRWDGCNQEGNKVPNGIYLCTLHCANRVYKTKITIVR